MKYQNAVWNIISLFLSNKSAVGRRDNGIDYNFASLQMWISFTHNKRWWMKSAMHNTKTQTAKTNANNLHNRLKSTVKCSTFLSFFAAAAAAINWWTVRKKLHIRISVRPRIAIEKSNGRLFSQLQCKYTPFFYFYEMREMNWLSFCKTTTTTTCSRSTVTRFAIEL